MDLPRCVSWNQLFFDESTIPLIKIIIEKNVLNSIMQYLMCVRCLLLSVGDRKKELYYRKTS